MDNLVERANRLIESGELHQAERIFHDACSRSPDNVHALAGYARVATLQLHWADALVRWRQLADVMPDNPQAWIGQGNALIQLEQLDRAEAVFQEACSRWPDNLHVRSGFARVAVLQQRWEEALDRWRKMAIVAPDNPQPWIGQGNALAKLRKYGEADLVFQYAFSRWPDNVNVLIGYAWLSVLQQHWEDALERWIRVLDLAPDNPQGWIGRGNTLIKMGDLAQAEIIFQQACTRCPGNVNILSGYARVAGLQLQWEAALERWRRVENLVADKLPARMEQANALIELGELDSAEKLCLSSQAEYPDHLKSFFLHHIILERRRRMRDRSNGL